MDQPNKFFGVGLIVVVLIVLAAAGYFLYRLLRGNPTPTPNPNPNPNPDPGTPSAIGSLRLANDGVTPNAWMVSWNAPTVGTPPINYQYTVARVTAPTVPLQEGSTTNTNFVIDFSQVPSNTPIVISVTPSNVAGTGPVSSINTNLPRAAPSVTNITPLPGNSDIIVPIPNTNPQQYYLAFNVQFDNVVTPGDSNPFIVMSNGTIPNIVPQSVVLDTTSATPYLNAQVRFCTLQNGVPCTLRAQAFLAGNPVVLNIQASNALGNGQPFTRNFIRNIAPNQVSNIRVNPN